MNEAGREAQEMSNDLAQLKVDLEKAKIGVSGASEADLQAKTSEVMDKMMKDHQSEMEKLKKKTSK